MKIRRSPAPLLLLPLLILLLTSCLAPHSLHSLRLVNDARGSIGVPPVIENPTLTAKAQSWAEVLASRGSLEHSNLTDGAGPGWQALGENLAMAGSIDEAHQLFLGSPSHRDTMLSGRYSQVGIGTVEAGGRIFVVQVYGG
jgi:uncharacterized protein YkwD